MKPNAASCGRMCDDGLWIDAGIVFLSLLPLLIVAVAPLAGGLLRLGWGPSALGDIALRSMLNGRISPGYLLFLINALGVFAYILSGRTIWDVLTSSQAWGSFLEVVVQMLGLALVIIAVSRGITGGSGLSGGIFSILVWAVLLYIFLQIQYGAVDHLKSTSIENLLCCWGLEKVVTFLKSLKMWK